MNERINALFFDLLNFQMINWASSRTFVTCKIILFRENCYTVPEQKCETVDKEVTTQECSDVVQPPVCETVLGEDCYFVTKNTCSQESEPLPDTLPGYESDKLPGR